LIAEAEALRDLKQKTVKGQLRELFISRIISKFLTSQYGVGTGVIINQKGMQSKQIDIIIYDRRILPPFIEKQKIGVYPAESVLAGIEVRSWVSKDDIRYYSREAKKLFSVTYNPESSHYRDLDKFIPFYALVGFFENGIFRDESYSTILHWMMDNATPLFGVCIVNKLSWLRVMRPEGSLKMVDENNEETKAFVAVLLDNIRTHSQRRYLVEPNEDRPKEDEDWRKKHRDWLSIYIRDQTWRAGEF
jgi:hypothetical protein